MIKNILFSLIFIFLIFSLIGCSSRQDIYISDSGVGAVSVEIHLDKILTSYAGDLLGGFSSSEGNDVNLFDTQKIGYIISDLESVSLTEISSESSEKLQLKLDFVDPGRIFEENEKSGIPNVISFSRRKVGNKDRKKISFYLSKDNFSTILSLIGMKDSEILDTFGPQDNPYTESEYLDLMEFLFEEYESSYKISSIVKSSEIIVNLQVDGNIISSEGFTPSESGSEVLIKIPLLDIVTLEKPIEIVVEWE